MRRIQGGEKNVTALSALFILNHILCNTVTKLSEKSYKVSNNKFNLTSVSCKQFSSFPRETHA